jgi:putative tricarboxylic transport membrane protein
MRKLDFWGDVFWLLFAIYISIEAYRLGLGSWRNPGDGYFPFGAGLLLGIMSLSTLIKPPGMSEKASDSISGELKWKNVVLVLITMFLYAFLFAKIGFVLCTLLLFVFLVRFIGHGRWVTSIAVGIIVTLSSYVLFEILLKAELPISILGF